MAAPNGAGNAYGALNGAGAVAMGNSIIPSPGQYADMQMLMQNLEQLSGWLQQNREDWNNVQEGLARVQNMQGPGQPALPIYQNGEVEAEGELTIPSLQRQLHDAKKRVLELEQHNASLQQANQMYESAFSQTTHMIRDYTYSQSSYITSLHRHYSQQLQQSRYETLQAQLVHQEWQAGLETVSNGMRGILKYREEQEEKGDWKKRFAALKLENRLLRKKVGWDPLPPDSDEEEEEEGEGAIERGSGRPSRAAQGGGTGGGSPAVMLP